jgi:hypothetical protein
MVYQSFQKTLSNASRYQSFNEANRSTWMPSTLLNNRARLMLMWQYLFSSGDPVKQQFYPWQTSYFFINKFRAQPIKY